MDFVSETPGNVRFTSVSDA